MSFEILTGAVAFLVLVVTWVMAPHGTKAEAPATRTVTATR